MGGILILPAWLIVHSGRAPLRDWGVRVVGDKIGDVAPNAILRARYSGDEVWEAPGDVLAPGFVNAHTHLYGVLAHGIPLKRAPADFWAFLKEFWWPLVEDRLDHEMICAATDLQCVRMLQSGVTSFYDITEAPSALPGCLSAQAEVVERRGLRAILSFEATERVSAENGQLGLQENAGFIETCRHQPRLITGMVCFHTTFTCSADFIRQAFETARSQGSLVHLHCSEGRFEPEYCIERSGMRPIQYYRSLGVLGPEMVASQCVQIDLEEIALIGEAGVRVTHMPLSNCEVGGGIAPLPELLDAGVTVGLGSDGYIDDFFEVMRGAFLIHKANHQDPGVVPARAVWHMATEGGARAIGLEKVGRLETGWLADVQLIDASLPTPLTEDNLYDQLLLYRNHTHVRGVMVAGRPLMGNRTPRVDMDELRMRVHTSAARLWGAVAP